MRDKFRKVLDGSYVNTDMVVRFLTKSPNSQEWFVELTNGNQYRIGDGQDANGLIRRFLSVDNGLRD